MPLSVTLSKLQRYCKEQGGCDLALNGLAVTLTFVPNFPEAIEKSDLPPPRVTMIGKIVGQTVNFEHVEREDSSGSRVKEPEESELAYGSWISFIEENY